MADVTPYLQGLTDFVTMDGTQHHLPGWDLIIAHPPCTYLTKVSSVLLWHRVDGRLIIDEDRYKKGLEGRTFFLQCLNAAADFVAVENPIPMALFGLPRSSCYASPHWYGVKYTKKTLYWLRNLPPLFPTIIHPHPKPYHYSSRGKYRSRTFPLMAEAIAEQWGSYVEQHLYL